MPRRTLSIAIVVVMVSLLATRWAEAQASGRSDSRRDAGSSSSASSQVGGWWSNQVRSFKSRWSLSSSPSKAARPAKKVTRRNKPASRVKKQTDIRQVSHQMPAVSAQPAASPQTIPWAVAPSPSKPVDPANAGLVPGYPQFSGSLYPSPRPDVPYQVGGTVITNQALAPHEMLYPHSYRALYPPFYYKVSGDWMVTPCGVWSRDRWKLEGTEVEVKYRPQFGLFSYFMPPVLR